MIVQLRVGGGLASDFARIIPQWTPVVATEIPNEANASRVSSKAV